MNRLAFALTCTGAASAAGLLGTSQNVLDSAFCQTYACDGPYLVGPDRLYDLESGNRLAVRYGTAGRISRLSVLFDGDDLSADMDSATISALQRLAFGRVAKTIRAEACYGSRNALTVASRPDATADTITCMNDGDVTRVDINVSSAHLNRPLPAAAPFPQRPPPPQANSSSASGTSRPAP